MHRRALPADAGASSGMDSRLSPQERGRTCSSTCPTASRPGRRRPWPGALDFTLGYFGGAGRRRPGDRAAAARAAAARRASARCRRDSASARCWRSAARRRSRCCSSTNRSTGSISARPARSAPRCGHAARGRTLFLSIHQIADAARVCDRFVLLSGGRVRGEGTLDELVALAGARGGPDAIRPRGGRPCAHLAAPFVWLAREGMARVDRVAGVVGDAALIGPLVGVSFISAVRTYAELSGPDGTAAGVGEAFSPLVGIWAPTFSACELAAAFLLPFVAIRLVVGRPPERRAEARTAASDAAVRARGGESPRPARRLDGRVAAAAYRRPALAERTAARLRAGAADGRRSAISSTPA